MGEAHALPPGFRFHPTDEELISYYLMKKVLDSSFTGRAIAEIDLNKCEPWHLPEKAKIGEKEWYFFNLRDRKYPTGLRTNRATEAGYWKATGKDREIFSSRTHSLVGMKKTLVFYGGRAPKGEKSNWVMHEYRLEGVFSYHHLSKTAKVIIRVSVHSALFLSKKTLFLQDEWVISRVFQKSGGGKKSFQSGFHRNSLYLGFLPPLTASSEVDTGSDETVLAKIGTEQHVPCFSTENNFNPNLGSLLNYQQESKLPMEETSLQFPFLFSTTVPGSGSVSFGMEPETVSGFRSSALLRAMVEFGEGDKMDHVPIQRATATGVDGYDPGDLEQLLAG